MKVKKISIGPLSKRFGANPRGSKSAAKVMLPCVGGPLNRKVLALTPGCGSLPIRIYGEAGAYLPNGNWEGNGLRFIWAPTN